MSENRGSSWRRLIDVAVVAAIITGGLELARDSAGEDVERCRIATVFLMDDTQSLPTELLPPLRDLYIRVAAENCG